MAKYNLTGTDQIPEKAFVNLAAAGRVVDEAGVAHGRISRGEKLEGCTVEEPDRLASAVALGRLTVEEVAE